MAEKVRLTGAQETLLITLYGKALESREPDSLLRDRFADEVVGKIDYDFARLRVTRDMAIGLAMRAWTLDEWTRQFRAADPAATVLNLACGLDSRVFRVDPPADARWFDLDFPEVIDLRRRLYPGRVGGYRMLASSVTDPAWLAEVPADRPVFVVAEGLMPYLRPADGRRLLERITAHFPEGELAFDAYSRLGIRLLRLQASVRATGASLHWGLDHPRQLERWVPRLRLIGEHNVYETEQVARMSPLARAILPLWNRVPALRRVGRLLRYRFSRDAGPGASRPGRARRPGA